MPYETRTRGLLYGVLFLIVRRADRIIKKQYADLRDNDARIKSKNTALSEAHERLEARVEERTAELRQNEHSLRLARDQAEAANRSKSEFLAAMSHELRPPLNAVIGFSEIIESETFGPVGTDKYRDYAHDINASGQHLLAVINDILDLSKIEFGADALREESIDVADLVRSALTLVAQRADHKELKVSLDVPADLPALWADPRKLKQILVNLLSNAIKFTEPGGNMTVRAWCQTDGGYVFQIIDTGIGIAPADLPKALSRFGQVDSDLNRQYEGSGLGLPLTQAFAEAHGGDFELQSEIGVGTKATVRFPAERVVSPPSGRASPTAAPVRQSESSRIPSLWAVRT